MTLFTNHCCFYLYILDPYGNRKFQSTQFSGKETHRTEFCYVIFGWKWLNQRQIVQSIMYTLKFIHSMLLVIFHNPSNQILFYWKICAYIYLYPSTCTCNDVYAMAYRNPAGVNDSEFLDELFFFLNVFKALRCGKLSYLWLY